jgi:hypothetical protein
MATPMSAVAVGDRETSVKSRQARCRSTLWERPPAVLAGWHPPSPSKVGRREVALSEASVLQAATDQTSCEMLGETVILDAHSEVY